jgi:hypothetical protein
MDVNCCNVMFDCTGATYVSPNVFQKCFQESLLLLVRTEWLVIVVTFLSYIAWLMSRSNSVC